MKKAPPNLVGKVIFSSLFRRMVRAMFRVKGLRIIGHFVRRHSYYDIERVVGDFDDDLKIGCHLNEHMGSWIYWRGAYASDELSVLRELLQPNAIFIDVGANQGIFTLFAAKRVPEGRVIAFEPQRAIYERLQRNVAMNGFDNVKLSRKGLWSTATQSEVFDAAGEWSDGSINEGTGTMFPDESRNVRGESISLIPLDAFLEREGIDRVDVIKIDVEGAEYEVLQGARATLDRFRPHVMLEASRSRAKAAGHSLEELLALLDPHYHFSIIHGGGLAPLDAANLTDFQNVLCSPKARRG